MSWEWINIARLIPILSPFGQWLRVNWLSIVLFGVICLLSFVVVLLFVAENEVCRELQLEVLALERQVVTYEGCRTGSPFGDAPIRVTFTDGVVAYVNYLHQPVPLDPKVCSSAHLYLPGDGIVWEPVTSEERVPREDCKSFRLPNQQAHELSVMVQASVIAELESLTFAEARKDRRGIAKRVRERVSPRFTQYGVQLGVFYLLEFCAASRVDNELPTDPDVPGSGLER